MIDYEKSQSKQPPEEKLKRMRTMARKIKEDFPDFVKMFSPEEIKNYGMFIRVRSIQMRGNCCSVELSKEDMREILSLCAKESVHDKASYLGKMLSKLRIDATLRSLRSNRKLRNDERIRAVAKYVRDITGWQLRAIWGYIEGKYSMSDIIDMCELCNKKTNPAAYMIGVLKHGYRSR